MTRMASRRQMRRIYEALVVEVAEGEGVNPDPVRHVSYVYTKDLRPIGRIDSWEDREEIEEMRINQGLSSVRVSSGP